MCYNDPDAFGPSNALMSSQKISRSGWVGNTRNICMDWQISAKKAKFSSFNDRVCLWRWQVRLVVELRRPYWASNRSWGEDVAKGWRLTTAIREWEVSWRMVNLARNTHSDVCYYLKGPNVKGVWIWSGDKQWGVAACSKFNQSL